jgi:hypothetical protein
LPISAGAGDAYRGSLGGEGDSGSNTFMNNLAAAGLGCVAALGLWKGTKERWVPTLLGMLVIVVTVKYWSKANDDGDWILGWFIWMVGGAVFTAGFYSLKRYDRCIAESRPFFSKAWKQTPKPSGLLQSTQKPPQSSQKKEEQEEPEFELDVTTAYDSMQSGWERWTIFPNQNRLINDRCGGGPPRHEEIYEYAVRHTSVFVRLIEKSEEGFDGHEYEVFGGSVVQAQLEKTYAKRQKTWKDDDMLKDYTPEIASAKLQKQIAWHEIYGAIRYFILSKDSAGRFESRFFKDELERFTKAYATFDKRVEELGAVYNSRWDRYDAPEGATPEVKEDLRQKLSVFNFGFYNRHEFCQKDAILGVLKDALGEKQ